MLDFVNIESSKRGGKCQDEEVVISTAVTTLMI